MFYQVWYKKKAKWILKIIRCFIWREDKAAQFKSCKDQILKNINNVFMVIVFSWSLVLENLDLWYFESYGRTNKQTRDYNDPTW